MTAVVPDAFETQLERLSDWMRARGWEPLDHQTSAWRARGLGRSGLVLTPTGSGKTYAAFLGALAHRLAHPTEGTAIVFVTPLRALTRDITEQLRAPIAELGLPLVVDHRTGDTSSAARARQKRNPPDILVTTPESLALMMTYTDARDRFRALQTVIVDEWHALIESKRGTLLELTLSHIRGWAPQLTTWGLSATLGNPEAAARHLVGLDAPAELVEAPLDRLVLVEAIVPSEAEALPWSGHLGLHLLDDVVAALDIAKTTIVFTNTRSQAERWYAALVQARPEWFEWMGLHHASVEPEERLRVEAGMRDGDVRLVVATASLDLGIDVGSIEQVVQIGSPRSVARLLQRAGRSGHRPGEVCRVLCVPTHGIELLEIECLREAVQLRSMEQAQPPRAPVDVLVQHLVSCGLGEGFVPDEVWREVRRTASFAELSREAYDEAVSFAASGGRTLQHYEQFQRLDIVEGRYRVTSRRIAARHRMNIGTIDSYTAVQVRFLNGRNLGTVEEVFIARLRDGEPFLYQGAPLELVRLEGGVAYVRRSKKRTGKAPRWGGGLLPFSKPLGELVRRRWTRRSTADVLSRHVGTLIEHQAALSAVPDGDRLLVESLIDRRQHWLFLYPFEGFLTNEALGMVLATRLARGRTSTIAVAANEYGVALLAPRDIPLVEALTPAHLVSEGLDDDVREACNLSELARRKFRSVARVSGLVNQNLPGTSRKSKQLQASSDLLFDVFRDYDRANLLLRQAEREALEDHFDIERLRGALKRVETHGMEQVTLERPSPLAFPLIIERVRATVTNESIADRARRLQAQWSRAAGTEAR